ncbi:kinesin-like protein KIF22-A [Antedon mediterranea]|uniref:kinesin-like protein KIF22-A n=1 Tax=Antedon mediterranea TaxID=105859 RepID=UPI003AF8CEE9
MVQKSQVRVVIRIRPAKSNSESTSTTPFKPCVHQLSEKSLEIVNWRNIGETLKYEFDTVHNDAATQEDVYKSSVESFSKQILIGQNASIFAYGPTGAGKTHTMLGTETHPGIIPQAIVDVFAKISEEKLKTSSWEYQVYISYLEIYQEKVFDLLEPKDQDLTIRQDRQNKIVIPNLSEKKITNIDDFTSVFVPASQNRTVATTKLNSRSSRSHSILLVKVIKKEQCSPYRMLTGKMYLIDLAGSENNKRTGNKGIRLKESGCINTSLFVLGQVVDALNRNMPRVPYRDSKLTRLLQDSLGGNSHTCMITNISPEESSYMDTYTTLNLAAKSKTVINKPITSQTYEKPKPQTSKRKHEIQEGAVKNKKLKPNKLEIKDQKMVLNKKKSLENQTETKAGNMHAPPVKFLSPFLRKQRHFHDDVTAKLLSLEEKLMKLQDKQDTSEDADASLLHKDMLDDIQKSRNDMEWMVKKNKELSARLGGTCSLENERTKGGRTKDVHFVKAVKVESNGKENIAQRIFQPDPNQQAKHNLSVLNLLNTGSVKELRSLQSIGEKRAKLIDNWRQMYGEFKCIDDLSQIPAMTAKVVETIKKNNLVTF